MNISATASDSDGDPTTLEWDNKAADGYYAVGTHTVRVRAKDATGLYSDWVSKTFTVANSAPTAPMITRTPNGNSVAPGTPVTITAASSDPDGDPVTLIWEGRNAETQTYPAERTWCVSRRWIPQAPSPRGPLSFSLWRIPTAAVA